MPSKDTITYFCTILGIFKAAGVVFIVSPRNTPAAVAELLQRTGTTHALVSSDAPMQELAASALTILTKSGHQVEQHPMPLFEDLYPEAEDPTSPFAADVDIPTKYNMSAPGFALHSSGPLSETSVASTRSSLGTQVRPVIPSR